MSLVFPTIPILRYVVSFSCLLLLAGCGANQPVVTSEKSVGFSLKQTTFATPISDEELKNFQQLVPRLPGAQVPEFSSAAELFPDPQNRNPEALVEVCRQQYQAALDPFRQAELWKHDPALMNCLESQGIEPEALAMLLIRISSAWAASALLDEQQHIPAAALQLLADERVEKLTASIYYVDAHADRYSPKVREHLNDALRETVALSEFLGLLAEVPIESAVRIRDHRLQLQSLLPEVATVADFERRLETTTTVVPVGFESP